MRRCAELRKVHEETHRLACFSVTASGCWWLLSGSERQELLSLRRWALPNSPLWFYFPLGSGVLPTWLRACASDHVTRHCDLTILASPTAAATTVRCITGRGNNHNNSSNNSCRITGEGRGTTRTAAPHPRPPPPNTCTPPTPTPLTSSSSSSNMAGPRRARRRGDRLKHADRALGLEYSPHCGGYTCLSDHEGQGSCDAMQKRTKREVPVGLVFVASFRSWPCAGTHPGTCAITGTAGHGEAPQLLNNTPLHVPEINCFATQTCLRD